MKNRIKNTLGAIISIIGLGALIFVTYLQIQTHDYGSIIWHILGIIILLITAFIYFRDAIKNVTDDTSDEDSDVKTIETNAKSKSLDIISNLCFWCGFALMLYASSQLKEAPQFSYILFAISGTLTAIWLITLITQLFYVFKYAKQLDDTED